MKRRSVICLVGLALTAAAALLLEKEKISRDEFEALFEKEETGVSS